MVDLKRPIKILGIDPGSQVCGYAFITTSNPYMVSRKSIIFNDVGALKADKKLSFIERLAALHETMFELVSEHKPDICIIEDAFFGLNARSALKLGQARGALTAAVSRCGVKVEEVTPTFVKKHIVGHGMADKEQVSEALKGLVGFDRGSLPHDSTDALAIALSFCYTGGVDLSLERGQMELTK